jgi:hypothetical protein
LQHIIENEAKNGTLNLFQCHGDIPHLHIQYHKIGKRINPLPLNAQPDVWVQITVPNEFQPVGKYNIGVTAGTEGDICPEDWIDKLMQCKLVIVPSEFTKSIY